MENIVYFNYTNVLHVTAYAGLNTVARFYRKDLSLDQVKQILSQHESYTVKRKEKKIKNYAHIYAYFKRELIQIDLVDTSYMSRHNKGITFLLNIYDTATKYAWSFPIKRKTGQIVSETLDNFFSSLSTPVKRAFFDKGREFTCALSQEVFKKHNIKTIHPKPGKHAYGQ